MNVEKQIEKQLDTLPDSLAPIREFGRKYLKSGFDIDQQSGAVLIGSVPQVGSYLIQLFPPATLPSLEKYEKMHGLDIPVIVREVLTCLNGAFFFGIESECEPSLSLFGMSSSMSGDAPLLDRNIRMCLDLSLANKDWISEYKGSRNMFYFGARPFNDSETLGYFANGDGKICALRQNGKKVAEWNDVESLLRDELPVAEKRVLKFMK